MHVLSIQVGLRRALAGRGRESAIRKSEVTEAVFVGREGLSGDEQADRRFHGGPDRAVSAYPVEHYEAWAEAYPDGAFAPGTIGENLTLRGSDEASVLIGDVFRLGSAVVQVSMPRVPCAKIDLATGQAGLLAQVVATGRIGWLYRVLEEGTVVAPTDLVLLERGEAAWSVARTYQVYERLKRGDASALEPGRELLELEPLAAGWRESIGALTTRLR